MKQSVPIPVMIAILVVVFLVIAGFGFYVINKEPQPVLSRSTAKTPVKQIGGIGQKLRPSAGAGPLSQMQPTHDDGVN